MPREKTHLRDLYRTDPDAKVRKGYLRLDMNESVSGLPGSFVREILREISSDYLAMYPTYRRLQEKIAAHNKLRTENVCISNGSDAAIKYIFDAYISPRDKILLAAPTFAMYPVYCKMFQAEPVTVEYKKDFSFPTQEFVEKIHSGIKMAVVVNPNNPTGTAVDPKALLTIIKKAADRDVLLIVDEAYFYFYSNSVIGNIKKYKNLIVLRTFSKLLGMAAARLGFAAACPEIIENLQKVKSTFDVNGLAIQLAERLLDKPALIRHLIRDTEDGKRYLIKKLTGEGIGYRNGHANFVLIKCGDRVKEIIRKLSEDNILVNGDFRQDFLKDYIRVTVANSVIMERFWKSFINIWKAKNVYKRF